MLRLFSFLPGLLILSSHSQLVAIDFILRYHNKGGWIHIQVHADLQIFISKKEKTIGYFMLCSSKLTLRLEAVMWQFEKVTIWIHLHGALYNTVVNKELDLGFVSPYTFSENELTWYCGQKDLMETSALEDEIKNEVFNSLQRWIVFLLTSPFW